MKPAVKEETLVIHNWRSGADLVHTVKAKGLYENEAIDAIAKLLKTSLNATDVNNAIEYVGALGYKQPLFHILENDKSVVVHYGQYPEVCHGLPISHISKQAALKDLSVSEAKAVFALRTDGYYERNATDISAKMYGKWSYASLEAILVLFLDEAGMHRRFWSVSPGNSVLPHLIVANLANVVSVEDGGTVTIKNDGYDWTISAISSLCKFIEACIGTDIVTAKQLANSIEVVNE